MNIIMIICFHQLSNEFHWIICIIMVAQWRIKLKSDEIEWTSFKIGWSCTNLNEK